MSRFYIAAPFFNAAQLDLVQRIETHLHMAGVPFYSPRLIHGPRPVPIRTHADAKKCFRANVENILDCTHMLAVVDWLNEPGFELRLTAALPGTNTGEFASPALHVPDAGTVFEMGVAYGLSGAGIILPTNDLNIPVWIYTERSSQDKLNIMLSQSADRILRGPDALRAVFPGNGEIRRDRANAFWTGRHT